MAKPGLFLALSRGGFAADRGFADEDLRGDGGVHPLARQMLADGGEVDDVEVSDGLIVAAEDIMDSLNAYVGGSPSESDSKVERASKEAARRAKAKILAQSLKSFFMLCDAEPHEEGEHEYDEE